jgi:hypothetical protein
MAAVFGIVAIAIAITTASAANAAPPAISGKVTLPGGGLPVPSGTRVHLLKPDKDIFGYAQVDPSTGAYSFDGVPPGMYILRAVPPEGSDYTPSDLYSISVLRNPITLDLQLTIPSIVGTVYAPDAATPVTATVDVFAFGIPFESRLAPGGSIKIGGLAPGDYFIQARRATGDPYWQSAKTPVTVNSGVTTTKNLTLTNANVYGLVKDSSGNPVPGSTVRAIRTPNHTAYDVSDLHGYYAIGGLDNGLYLLRVLPPWNQPGLIPPLPVTFTIPPPQQQKDFQFLSAKKIVTGTVQTNTGVPVYHALVLARRVDKYGEAHDLTNSSGLYRLELSEGLWALTVEHQDDSNPAKWVYPNSPQLVYFLHNRLPESRTVNFTVLSADSTVIGSVLLPGGSAPPFTVTVALHGSDGVGASTGIDASGAFTLNVPHGGYTINVRPDNPNYAGPALPPVDAPPSGTLNLGIITLVPRDSLITGTLTVSGTSTPVAAVPVIAWLDEGPGGAQGESDSNGLYALATYTGTWLARPAPKPDQPYLYLGAPQEVDIAGSGNLISDVNFGLTQADATIHGALVDDNGTLVADASGWAAAVQIGNPAVRNGAPARNGAFDVLLPGGVQYKVTLRLSPGAPYLVSGGAQTVTVGVSQTANVTFTLKAIDSHIVGALWDPRARVIPTGVAGSVFAWMRDLWTRTAIDPRDGTYNLGVIGGVWGLDYHVDPSSNYVALRGPRAIPVPNGVTVTVPLPVTTKDGTITGVVLAPNGSPMSQTVVFADGLGPETGRLHLAANVGADGSFAIKVAHGAWTLRAVARHDSRLINPAARHVVVRPGGTLGPIELRFVRADALITGTLSLQNGAVHTGTLTLWAWNNDDQYNKVYARLIGGTGVYSMPVISNTTWHLGAAFETRNTFFITETRVVVGGGDATQNLVLSGPFPKPGPLVVTFDASEAQHLELADGTRIYIPAGALPVSGQVILHITPVATFPRQHHANVYRYSYTFEAFDADGNPIEQDFNQDVLITFTYDKAELIAAGINENWLKPAYFSTTTDSWTIPDSYVVDTDSNVVSMQINHFTDFALTSAPEFGVYLPLVSR